MKIEDLVVGRLYYYNNGSIKSIDKYTGTLLNHGYGFIAVKLWDGYEYVNPSGETVCRYSTEATESRFSSATEYQARIELEKELKELLG